jgi:hypothetical protein
MKLSSQKSIQDVRQIVSGLGHKLEHMDSSLTSPLKDYYYVSVQSKDEGECVLTAVSGVADSAYIKPPDSLSF